MRSAVGLHEVTVQHSGACSRMGECGAAWRSVLSHASTTDDLPDHMRAILGSGDNQSIQISFVTYRVILNTVCSGMHGCLDCEIGEVERDIT